MITSDIIELIRQVEDMFPVDQWSVDGIHVWPLIRIKLYSYLYTFRVEAGKRTNKLANPVSTLARHGAALVTGLAKYVHAYCSDFRNNRRASSIVDVVFRGDGISFTQIDGVWYEKFCDPLIARLEHRGMRCFVMSPLREYFVPRRTPSLFVQPAIDAAIISALISARLRAPKDLNLPRYAECRDYLATRDLGIPLQKVLNVRQDAARVRNVANYYKKQLARLRPAVAFIVSYYSVDGMAFNLACRETGIPSIEIQHGAAGNLNPAYGRWGKVPAQGYALLPSVFWCWGAEDADAIRHWNATVRRWHRAMVGGHPWLALWQRGTASFIPRYDQRVHEIKAAGTYDTHILVTLQYGLGDAAVLAPVLAAMRSAPPSWCWWVRLHPAMLAEREQIRELLHASGAHFDLDNATDLPLYALLKHADVHVTHSSYTVVEAEAYGVPSIVFSEYGADLLGAQLARGTATTAYEGPEINSAIAADIALRGTASVQRHRIGPIDLDRGIDEVLRLATRDIGSVAGRSFPERA